jgi:hypothetical protein
MKYTESKVRELAAQLSKSLETRTRNNGDKFTCLKDGSPEWMRDVIHAVHGDKLPDDYTYKFIERCADTISEYDGDPTEAISEIEPDVYTSDLTAWLHSRAGHVEYLSQALTDYEPKDGFQALQIAQLEHIKEVGYSLIAELEQIA